MLSAAARDRHAALHVGGWGPPCVRRHPVWMCGLRPFFLLAALGAPLFIGIWIAFLALGLPLPVTPGGPFVWHAHELIFGVALAAIAGFALTAIPEFTATPDFGRDATRRLAALWLIGRVAFWSSGILGLPALTLAALAHLGLLAALAVLLTPRLWHEPERRHLAFLWTLILFGICVAGFYVDALRGAHPARWLHAALGVLMTLIVIAMSRISMRIVNGAIEERAVRTATSVEYRARPPRRNLAVFCICVYTLAEFFAPGSRIGGWLALAAAAALLNLLNDWHIGRALFRRWPFMLYGVYVLMAAGYALMGATLVLDGAYFSAGRHLLAVGAMGLAIYAVLCIAGRMHCGLPLDERLWVPVGAWLIVAGALARAATAWTGPSLALLGISGCAWGTTYVLYVWKVGSLLLGPRTDDGSGCEGRQAVERFPVD